MCDLDPQGGGKVLIKRDQHEQHLWGDLDPDEDEQRLSGEAEVEVGKQIWKNKNERRKGKDRDSSRLRISEFTQNFWVYSEFMS